MGVQTRVSQQHHDNIPYSLTCDRKNKVLDMWLAEQENLSPVIGEASATSTDIHNVVFGHGGKVT